jgi:hypothetical protein
MEVGIPGLEKGGFVKSPFKGSWHGEYNKSIKTFIYQFTRLTGKNYLEKINVFIGHGDKWIQIYLNIFELLPQLKSISQLEKQEGTKFGIPPNSLTKMRLRVDDYKGPPIFYMLFLPEHKIGCYFTKWGYEVEISRLKNLIKSDMENIDGFVKRWHELHKPIITDHEGNLISKTGEYRRAL